MLLKNKRTLLTGGSGFIGRNIVEQLGHKHELIVPTRLDLDLADAEAVLNFIKEANVDLVIHSANIGGNRKQLGLQGVTQGNLRIFYNIIRAKKYYSRLVVLGSGAEYDKSSVITMVKESDFEKSVPKDEYGFSKYAMAKYAENVDYITHLRIFGVYGKYEDYQTRFISNSICKALLGLPVTIKQDVYFDYLFINDFVRIIDRIISDNDLLSNKFYNLGTGRPVSLMSLANIIIRELDNSSFIKIASEGLGKEYSANTDLLMSELKDFEFTSHETAIKELIEYYKVEVANIDRNSLLNDI
ncbi:MAG: NAD-dependent epimerase/dehydratase family protein [Candidatus Falkowbacteria bacterium]